MGHKSRMTGVMFTMTTYGMWLRGDQRGWVEDGRTFPPAPALEAHDRKLLKHPAFMFAAADLSRVGAALGRALIDRLQQRLLALTVRPWHVHFVVADSDTPAARIAKCAKDSARYELNVARPIWTEGYDKRFCCGEESLRTRIAYVERHNTEAGLPPRPWAFLLMPDE